VLDGEFTLSAMERKPSLGRADICDKLPAEEIPPLWQM
jgi:hypothetical protein